MIGVVISARNDGTIAFNAPARVNRSADRRDPERTSPADFLSVFGPLTSGVNPASTTRKRRYSRRFDEMARTSAPRRLNDD